jgi:xanthine dehydrogenase YagS FAD-binding subunit
MKPFKHVDASSVDQALELLTEFGIKACMNAGGTDLLGVLKTGILAEYPELVINLKTIPGLDGITTDSNGVMIGPMTRLTDIVDSEQVKEHCPALVQAVAAVGSPELRNMATIGGNLCQDTRCWYYRYPHEMGGRMPCYRKGKGPCHAVAGDNRYHAIMGGEKCYAVCPSDAAIALAALDATVIVQTLEGERSVALEDFYDVLGPRLKPGEIMTRIRIPPPPAEARQTFLKFRLREAVDFAVASVGVCLSLKAGVCQDARIVLGAVAPTPVLATAAVKTINGKPINEATAQRAAEAAVADAKPLSRNAYKVEITKTLVKRALLSLGGQ